jgi:hypothetical protein
VTIGVVAAYGVGAIISTALFCRPLEANWNHNVKGRCINTKAFYMSQSIINLITDLAILIIPTPLLWSLKLAPKKRLQVVLMFAVGIL